MKVMDEDVVETTKKDGPGHCPGLSTHETTKKEERTLE